MSRKSRWWHWKPGGQWRNPDWDDGYDDRTPWDDGEFGSPEDEEGFGVQEGEETQTAEPWDNDGLLRKLGLTPYEETEDELGDESASPDLEAKVSRGRFGWKSRLLLAGTFVTVAVASTIYMAKQHMTNYLERELHGLLKEREVLVEEALGISIDVDYQGEVGRPSGRRWFVDTKYGGFFHGSDDSIEIPITWRNFRFFYLERDNIDRILDHELIHAWQYQMNITRTDVNEFEPANNRLTRPELPVTDSIYQAGRDWIIEGTATAGAMIVRGLEPRFTDEEFSLDALQVDDDYQIYQGGARLVFPVLTYNLERDSFARGYTLFAKDPPSSIWEFWNPVRYRDNKIAILEREDEIGERRWSRPN